MGAVIEVHMGCREGHREKEYPIIWGAKDENLSAKVLKFKWNLRGNIKFWGKTHGEGQRGHYAQGLEA